MKATKEATVSRSTPRGMPAEQPERLRTLHVEERTATVQHIRAQPLGVKEASRP